MKVKLCRTLYAAGGRMKLRRVITPVDGSASSCFITRTMVYRRNTAVKYGRRGFYIMEHRLNSTF